MTKRIAIIDLDSVAYTIGNGNKILLPDGSYKKEGNRLVYIDKTNLELKESCDKVMTDILRNSGASHYIGFIKGKNTIDFRRTVNPEYKAQRGTVPPAWWEYVKTLLITRWEAVVVNNIEVDDAVYITKTQLPDSFIMAIDGDLLGLPGTHYNWRKNEWVTVSAEDAMSKFWTDMIAGQPIDNVKGIPGKGEAYAKRLFTSPTMEGYHGKTFSAYTAHFGIDAGIREFYKNYCSLRTLESYSGFQVPEPIPAPIIKQKEEIPL